MGRTLGSIGRYSGVSIWGRPLVWEEINAHPRIVIGLVQMCVAQFSAVEDSWVFGFGLLSCQTGRSMTKKNIFSLGGEPFQSDKKSIVGGHIIELFSLPKKPKKNISELPAAKLSKSVGKEFPFFSTRGE